MEKLIALLFGYYIGDMLTAKDNVLLKGHHKCPSGITNCGYIYEMLINNAKL